MDLCTKPTPKLLLGTLKILPKSRLILQITRQHRFIATHEQLGELDGPVLQISTRQRPNLGLDGIFHIFVVILLVTQCSQQVEHTIARVLALLAQRVDKAWIQLG